MATYAWNRMSFWLLGLCLGMPLCAEAEEVPEEPAKTVQISPQKLQVSGYVTEKNNSLPLLQYQPYQLARKVWTAGFATTLASIAFTGTGIGVILVGATAEGSFTEQGRGQALATGGVLTGIGVCGIAVGAALFHVGRRDLLRMEAGLVPHASPSVRLFPSLSLSSSTMQAGLSMEF